MPPTSFRLRRESSATYLFDQQGRPVRPHAGEVFYGAFAAPRSDDNLIAIGAHGNLSWEIIAHPRCKSLFGLGGHWNGRHEMGEDEALHTRPLCHLRQLQRVGVV